jgi:hypothetical protein
VGRQHRPIGYVGGAAGASRHVGGDASHGHVEQAAPAVRPRLHHGRRRAQPGERIGDGVGAEHGLAGVVPRHQSAGDGGIVAEGDPARLGVVAAVARDRHPNCTRRRHHLFGHDAELPHGPRSRRLDDDVGAA